MNNKLIEAFPVTWRTMLKQVKIKATAGGQSSTIVTSKDYVYLASRNELHPYTDEPYASEGSHIYSWYTTDRHRVKFFGIPIRDDVKYFSGDTDPRDITSNNVSEGDIWLKTTESNRGYILHDGEWHAAYAWWARSPNVTSSTGFMFVGNGGYITGNNASYAYGVCPCFSI